MLFVVVADAKFCPQPLLYCSGLSPGGRGLFLSQPAWELTCGSLCLASLSGTSSWPYQEKAILTEQRFTETGFIQNECFLGDDARWIFLVSDFHPRVIHKI